MRKNNSVLIITGLMLALVPLACTIFVGGPAYPSASIAVSTEAVTSFEEQLHAAQTSAAQSGVLSISINETQITSLLAEKLNSQPDSFIRDPQVYLRDGEIQIYGKASQGNLVANVRIVLEAALDPDGQPTISVKSTNFGPFPAPQGLNDSISTMIDQAFTGTFGPAATGLRLESISIADGVMSVTGRVK